MEKKDFDSLVAAGRKCTKNRRVVGNNRTPRFESFHAPASICSEKVRCALFIKGCDFVSYDMDLSTQENYKPAYVAMRNLGRDNLNLVGEHPWTGSTSTEDMGFDPLVVPTLVDNLKKKVIVDSKKILDYLDQEIPSPQLYPKNCEKLNTKHVKLVDDTPHAALLYGGDPDNDTRPAFIKAFSTSLIPAQMASLEVWLNDKSLPNGLRPLYEAKVKKLKMVRDTINSKEEVLRTSMDLTKTFLQDLNSDLVESGGPWICGKKFTMADIAWHVSLLRFLTFGCQYFYEDLPEVLCHIQIFLSIIEYLR